MSMMSSFEDDSHCSAASTSFTCDRRSLTRFLNSRFCSAIELNILLYNRMLFIGMTIRSITGLLSIFPFTNVRQAWTTNWRWTNQFLGGFSPQIPGGQGAALPGKNSLGSIIKRRLHAETRGSKGSEPPKGKILNRYSTSTSSQHTITATAQHCKSHPSSLFQGAMKLTIAVAGLGLLSTVTAQGSIVGTWSTKSHYPTLGT